VQNQPQPRFRGNILQWSTVRRARPCRIYVVEPERYSPEQHGKVFNAAITALLTPQLSRVDPFTPSPTVANGEYFDLVTFPEAFLPSDELLSALNVLLPYGSLGCVHVGLRPTKEGDRHLFQISELSDLVASLSSLSQDACTDLAPFSEWLQTQSSDRRFNIGCLFTIDSDRQLRVCLHPKLIRSKFEASPLHEEHMTEADLLTLVTLLPTNKALFSVTIQPLLCSDALQLGTDRPHARPMDGVNTDAACLGETPPDHIDIVSVPTCTPQNDSPVTKGDPYRKWHPEFTDSFKRAASDDSLVRHHYAIFVLANFRTLRGSIPGGLSGVFVPLPFGRAIYPDFVNVSSYGRAKNAKGAENYWSAPGKTASTGRKGPISAM
jgi:hypothetical protein